MSSMPPNNHAERLREMAEYKLALSNGKPPPPRQAALKARTIHELHADDAAALLAGAEALEACEKLRAFADELAAQNMTVLHGMAYQLDRLLPKKEKSNG